MMKEDDDGALGQKAIKAEFPWTSMVGNAMTVRTSVRVGHGDRRDVLPTENHKQHFLKQNGMSFRE
jgi:hypothetical protein